MGKSIRSKRKKRLRTLKRELVEAHYDKKDVAKYAALEAAAAAPKLELPQRQRMELEPASRGRSPTRSISSEVPLDNPSSEPAAMEVDAGRSSSGVRGKGKLKVKGGVRKKRGKSKAKINREKKRKRKIQF